MSTTFTDAMLAFAAAERAHHDEAVACNARGIPMGNGFAQRLAHAGDVLERELRQMMREELSRFTGYNQGREGGADADT